MGGKIWIFASNNGAYRLLSLTGFRRYIVPESELPVLTAGSLGDVTGPDVNVCDILERREGTSGCVGAWVLVV